MKILLISTITVSGFFLTGCLQRSDSSSSASEASNALSSSVMSAVSFKMSAESQNSSNSDIEHVMVQVKELEVLIAGTQKAVKLVLRKNIGHVDLMAFNQGVLMDLMSLNVSNGSQIREIRLRLEESGNYLLKSNGDRCDLQTPSAQQSGLKVKLPADLILETGYSYNFRLNFDPHKSIVMQGNGGCLLKPVLKLSGASRVVIDQPDDPEEPINTDDASGNENPDDGGVSTPPNDDNGSGPLSGPVEGVDYIIVDADTILIPQPDGTFIVIEGVDLSMITIEEILSSLSP